MRLIDADALAAEILDTYGSDAGSEDVTAIYGMVINAPGIEAEPVRHGRWEPYEFGDDTWHKCSVCGTADKYINIVVRKGFADVRLVSKRNYCPICGAKMDEEEP